jgi:hypothetical protein
MYPVTSFGVNTPDIENPLFTALDDSRVPEELAQARRAFGGTAYPSDFDHADYQAWLDGHNAALSEAEEAVAYAEHLADCVRCELDAAAKVIPMEKFLASSKLGSPNRRIRSANIRYRRNRDNAEYLIGLQRSHDARYRRRLFQLAAR